MILERRVVDDRVFLLGLDKLYRGRPTTSRSSVSLCGFATPWWSPPHESLSCSTLS
jgi:hypothetical protein